MNILSGIRNSLILFVLCGSCAFAETSQIAPLEAAAGSALYQSEGSGGPLAYVDMARLFNEYPGTQSAVKVLQKEMDLKMAERQALTAALEGLSKEGGAEAVKLQLQKIQQYDQQVQTALDVRQTEVFAPIFEAIEGAVKTFGAENRYQAICVEPREGAEDVTEAVLQGLK